MEGGLRGGLDGESGWASAGGGCQRGLAEGGELAGGGQEVEKGGERGEAGETGGGGRGERAGGGSGGARGQKGGCRGGGGRVEGESDGMGGLGRGRGDKMNSKIKIFHERSCV